MCGLREQWGHIGTTSRAGQETQVWARMAGVGSYVLIGCIPGLNITLASRALTFFLRPSTAWKEALNCTRIPERLKAGGG